MKTPEELKALKEEYITVTAKLHELSDNELDFVVGGSSIEIADVLIKGLMSDKPHPGYVLAADQPKDPGNAQRSENCSNFLQNE